MDTAVNRSLAAAEPATLITGAGDKPVTTDEVQRVPDLLLTIKEGVDSTPIQGRFLLAGAANLLLMQRVSDSLAGRARYLTLWPMTRREQLGLAASGAWNIFFDEQRSLQ